MVRIKKENYEKLKKKRKLQQLDEEFKQGYIEKFVVYKEENKDFLSWLYNFYWDYYNQTRIYLYDKELANKPLIKFDKNGFILNTQEMCEILGESVFNSLAPSSNLPFKIMDKINKLLDIIVSSVCPDFIEYVDNWSSTLYNKSPDNIVMLNWMIYQEYIDKLWEKLYTYYSHYNNILFIDFSDIDIEDNLFYLFKIIEDSIQYNIVIIKNISFTTYKFLLDFGIQEKTSVLCFPFANDGRKFIGNTNLKQLDLNKQSQWYDFLEVNTSSMDLTKPLECKSLPKDLLYEKYNKTGFDLYENLQEWKREMNAPTRDDPEYRKMKKRVRKRDNNTCQCCGYHSDKKTHHKLEVHHIFGYKDHLDYRVEDSNCVVLCQDCHKKYHSLYGRKEVAPDTFMKFIRDYNNFHNESMQTTLEVYHA